MTPRDANSKGACEYDERAKLCIEDVAARPYSHPVATGWYAEDVPKLLAAIRDAIENIEGDVYLNAVDALDYEPMIAAIVETKQRLKAVVGDV